MIKNLFTFFRRFHIDHVDKDDTGKIAQTDLMRDFIAGFQICLPKCFMPFSVSGIRSGVDIDHGHRLARIDHDRAPVLQFQRTFQGLPKGIPNLFLQGCFFLFFDDYSVKMGAGAGGDDSVRRV